MDIWNCVFLKLCWLLTPGVKLNGKKHTNFSLISFPSAATSRFRLHFCQDRWCWSIFPPCFLIVLDVKSRTNYADWCFSKTLHKTKIFLSTLNNSLLKPGIKRLQLRQQTREFFHRVLFWKSICLKNISCSKQWFDWFPTSADQRVAQTWGCERRSSREEGEQRSAGISLSVSVVMFYFCSRVSLGYEVIRSIQYLLLFSPFYDPPVFILFAVLLKQFVTLILKHARKIKIVIVVSCCNSKKHYNEFELCDLCYATMLKYKNIAVTLW